MDVVARFLHILPAKKQAPKESATLERKSKHLITHDGWTPPHFDPCCVRVVLYQDHEVRGKKQMFDSKVYLNTTNTEDNVVHPLTQSINIEDSLTSSMTSSIGASLRSKTPLIKRPSSDSELLGEMMFGSMPMKLIGNSVKIHYIRYEEQLMITKVFIPQRKIPSSCSLNDFSDSCPLPSEVPLRNIEQPQSISKQHSFHYSLRPPSSSPDSLPKFYSQSYSNTNFSPYHSPTASLPLSLANSSGSHDYSPTQSLNVGVPVSTSSLASSLTRRLQRVRSTSLENGSELYHRILKPMDQPYSTRRGRKYAIGIVFSLSSMKPAERRQFQEFFFSHFTLIASSLEEFREKVEEALWNRKQVLSELVFKAFNSFVEDIQSLYCAQRIKSPVWLEIVSGSTSKREICTKFLNELSSLMHRLENKDTKFFLSSLITTVLSYHLAWVYTVSKSGSTTSRHHDRTTSRSLAVLAETHPYNPLWAQFGDLCGAVSDPVTVCRTIVVGKSASLVCRLLYLLTYFIRCSEIEEQGVFKCIGDSHAHFEGNELEESDIFPEESRTGSALTLLSESGRSSGLLNSSNLEKRETAPLVKPHPFSFSCANSISSSNGSFPELNKSFVTQSCGSLDGHSFLCPQSVTTSRKVHQFDSNICQSVPTRMIDPNVQTKPKPLTPFISYHARGTGVVTTTTATDNNSKRSHSVVGEATSIKNHSVLGISSDYTAKGGHPVADSTRSSNGVGHFNSPPTGSWYGNEGDPESSIHNCNSKLTAESSTESLSTGYQTISRNPSRTSLAASYSAQTTSLQQHNTVRRQGTCHSFDSGVFDQPSFVGMDSCQYATDSLQFSGLSTGISRPPSIRHEVSSCPQPSHLVNINNDSSLRLFKGSQMDETSSTCRQRSNAFSFSIEDRKDTKFLTSSIESHALSHDKLHNAYLMHSPHLHIVPGVTSHLSQSYDSHNTHYHQMHSSHTAVSHKAPSNTNAPPSCSLKCASSPSLFSMSANKSEGIPRNSSYKGLPIIDGVCPELDGTNRFYTDANQEDTHLKIQQIDVQESLSPVSMSYLTNSLHPLDSERNRMRFEQQFKDFSRVEINNLENEITRDLVLSPTPSTSTNSTPRLPHSTVNPPSSHPSSTCLSDFGHSLMVGYSDHYMPHFVLHGTSQPYTEFKDKLINNLSTMVKYSIIDEPIQHGVAIIADTDSLTCKVVAVSKSIRTVDGEIFSGVAQSSHSVQQLLQSVSSLWDMQMPPEFCLSHLEDCLMSLNERGQMLSNGLLEQSNCNDISKTLQKIHSSLNTNPSDENILHALAGVHVSNTDYNLSKELQTMCLHSLVK